MFNTLPIEKQNNQFNIKNTMNIKQKGFTLIELLVVIAIIGLLSSIVLVSMKGSTGKAKIAKSLEFSQTILNTIGVDAVGMWSFDEGGGIAYDKSGYGNHGTVSGAIWVNGDEDTPHWFANEHEGRWALSFNGATDFIDCGSSLSLNITDAITIEAWVKRAGTGTEIFFSKNHSEAYELGYVSDKLKGYIGGTVDDSIVGDTSITDTNWHHVVFTYIQSSGQAYLYLDGTVDKDEVLTATMGTTATHLFIGQRNNGNFRFNGIIDEVRIYASALSSSEIQQHYVEGFNRHEIALK